MIENRAVYPFTHLPLRSRRLETAGDRLNMGYAIHVPLMKKRIKTVALMATTLFIILDNHLKIE
jgi:hypothetical protein